MSTSPSQQHQQHQQHHSSTLPWILACVLPVLYLLSIPPVTVLFKGSWVSPYRAPYEWAYANTNFGDPLRRYEFWWYWMILDFVPPTEFDPPSVPQRGY